MGVCGERIYDTFPKYTYLADVIQAYIPLSSRFEAVLSRPTLMCTGFTGRYLAYLRHIYGFVESHIRPLTVILRSILVNIW